jgi:hypothetical protein
LQFLHNGYTFPWGHHPSSSITIIITVITNREHRTTHDHRDVIGIVALLPGSGASMHSGTLGVDRRAEGTVDRRLFEVEAWIRNFQ